MSPSRDNYQLWRFKNILKQNTSKAPMKKISLKVERIKSLYRNDYNNNRRRFVKALLSPLRSNRRVSLNSFYV